MASFEQVVKFPPGELREKGGASPPGEPQGGANPLGEPLRLAGDGSPYLLGEPRRLGEDASPHLLGEARELPARRKLPHGLPPFPVKGPVIQFVTVNAAERGGTSLLSVAEKILAAARFYHEHGRWFLYLFLIMPDHLHMLATFPSGNCKATCGAWKGFLRKTAGACFQSDCFEHRIRNESELAEKWHYIRENPVRKGLVGLPDEWPYWIEFDSMTERQTGGATGGAPLRLAEDGSPHLSGEPHGRANPPGEPQGGAHHLTGKEQ